jgi:hypothetical protein
MLTDLDRCHRHRWCERREMIPDQSEPRTSFARIAVLRPSCIAALADHLQPG